ncbi:hypothetical protein Esti_000148 [Eimeria stiedai]
MAGWTRWIQAPFLVACLLHLSSSTTPWIALADPVALKDSVGQSVDSASAFDLSATSEGVLSEVPISYSFLQEQNTHKSNSTEGPKKKRSWLPKLKLGSKKGRDSVSSDDSAEPQGGSAGDSDSDSEGESRGSKHANPRPRKKNRLTAFFKRSKRSDRSPKAAEESDEEQRGEVSEGASGGTSKGKKKGVLRLVFSKKVSRKGQHSNKSNGPLLSRSPKLLADPSAEEASAIPLLRGLPKEKQPLLPAEHPPGCMPVQVTEGFEDFLELASKCIGGSGDPRKACIGMRLRARPQLLHPACTASATKRKTFMLIIVQLKLAAPQQEANLTNRQVRSRRLLCYRDEASRPFPSIPLLLEERPVLRVTSSIDFINCLCDVDAVVDGVALGKACLLVPLASVSNLLLQLLCSVKRRMEAQLSCPRAAALQCRLAWQHGRSFLPHA